MTTALVGVNKHPVARRSHGTNGDQPLVSGAGLVRPSQPQVQQHDIRSRRLGKECLDGPICAHDGYAVQQPGDAFPDEGVIIDTHHSHRASLVHGGAPVPTSVDRRTIAPVCVFGLVTALTDLFRPHDIIVGHGRGIRHRYFPGCPR